MPEFRDALRSGRVMLMDGAMGTELQRAGLKPGDCGEAWNLTQPERVRAIHQAYVDAGAQCLLTNTFQANPAALARFGLERDLEAMNRAAVRLARSVSRSCFVLAAIGPMDVIADPAGCDRVLYSLQDADAVLLETWSAQFDAAVWRAMAPKPNARGVPVLLSLTFLKPGPGKAPCLPSGWTATEAARSAAALPIVALGVNCGRDLQLADVAAILREYRTVTDLPLLARPNAGTPVRSDAGWVYPDAVEKMATGFLDLIAAGAQLIGGCCGTTPTFIMALAKHLQRLG